MNATKGALCAALLATLAPTAGADVPGPQFASADLAAEGALSLALSLATRYEYAGGIIRCGDVYTYTEPQTSSDADGFRVRLRFPQGCTLAGIYHTHPQGKREALYSRADLMTACRLGVPSYIAGPRTDARRFDPVKLSPATCANADVGAADGFNAGEPLTP